MRTYAQKPAIRQKTTPAEFTTLDRAHFGHSGEVSSILHFQRTIGNQAVNRLLQAKPDGLEAASDATASGRFGHDFSRIPAHAPASVKIQSELAVNTPGDIYEQEADRISEQVMRMSEPPLQRACACGGGCPKCQTQQPSPEPQRLQTTRVQAADTGQTAAPSTVHEVLAAPGRPLDAATRAFMEPRFGRDLSHVRVHSDAMAERSARDVNAHAYTVGHNIVFGAGRFAPSTPDGKRLLAHELAHTLQQASPPGERAALSTSTRGWPDVVDSAAPSKLPPDSQGSTIVNSAIGAAMLQRAPTDEPKNLGDIRRVLREAAEVAKDLIEEVNGSRGHRTRPRRDLRRLKRRLRGIANAHPAAQGLLDQIEDLEKRARVREIERDIDAGAAKRKARETARNARNKLGYRPQTTKTPTTPTKTPPATATKRPSAPAATTGPKITARGVIKGGAGFGLQMLVFWWLGTKAAKAEKESREKLLAQSVDPEVDKFLTAQSATAQQMTTEHPSHSVYANVTADFDYTWTTSGIGGTPSMETVTAITFRDVKLSFQKVNKEQLLKEEDSGGAQVKTHWATKRVTWSLEIDFGETETEHHWRVLVHDAGQAARRGLSARFVAEGTHWGGKDLKSWEKWQDEQRRKWGEPTLAEQRAYDERELWVLAYIEYTAFYGPDDHYVAALRYLEEIRQRPRPIPGKPLIIR